VSLYETATGREAYRFKGFRGAAGALAFSPDGRRLAVADSDSTVLLLSVLGTARPPDAARRDELWAALAAEDPGPAFAAMRELGAAPHEAVALLGERLTAPKPPSEQVAKWIRELDDGSFAVREAASAELAKLGPFAEKALRDARKGGPSPEAKRRLDALLAALAEDAPPSPEQLRTLRAVAVLEQLGTPEARGLLDKLAQGAPGALVTEEAKAARERLRKLDEQKQAP
jgi:hypothetical protein